MIALKSKIFRFWKSLPYLLAFLFTVTILAIHMLPNVDSMLNENNTEISHVFLKSQIDYHKEIAPFARRPLTTFLMDSVSDAFHLKAGHAFILVNFSLLFLSGLLLYFSAKKIGATRQQALVNMTIYFLSFSILFAFFPPVFSFDEPLQYCFLLLALTAFVQQQWLWYVPLFTFALITRETSLLVLPALLFFTPGTPLGQLSIFSRKRLRISVAILWPLLFYGLFIGIYIWKFELLKATQAEMASRYSCFLENFENKKNTVESLTSIFLSLGPFLYFCYFYLKRTNRPLGKIRFVNAFLLTVAINTPIVILTAFARESRLFALPLVFIWPMFWQLFGKELKLLFRFELYPKIIRKWQYLFTFLILIFLNYFFCFKVYRKLGLGDNTFFSEYLFSMVFCIIVHFMLHHFSKKHPVSKMNNF